MSYRNYKFICKHCGKEYSAKSMKSQYCSEKCRTAAHREAKANDDFFNAMVTIRNLHRDGKIAALQQLRESIDELIKNNS